MAPLRRGSLECSAKAHPSPLGAGHHAQSPAEDASGGAGGGGASAHARSMGRLAQSQGVPGHARRHLEHVVRRGAIRMATQRNGEGSVEDGREADLSGRQERSLSHPGNTYKT